MISHSGKGKSLEAIDFMKHHALDYSYHRPTDTLIISNPVGKYILFRGSNSYTDECDTRELPQNPEKVYQLGSASQLDAWEWLIDCLVEMMIDRDCNFIDFDERHM